MMMISAEIAELARQAMIEQGVIPPSAIKQNGRAKLHDRDSKESVQYTIFENPDGSVVLNLHSFNTSYELQNVQLRPSISAPTSPTGTSGKGGNKGPKSPFSLYASAPPVSAVPNSVAAMYLRNRGISDTTIAALAHWVRAVEESGYYIPDANRNYRLLATCPAIAWGYLCTSTNTIFKIEAVFLSGDGRKNDAIRAAGGQSVKKQRKLNRNAHCGGTTIAPLIVPETPKTIGIGEGMETALSLHTLGLADTVYCSGGASKLDEAIAYLLDKFPHEIRVAYDDKATDAALGKLKNKLSGAGGYEKLLRVKVLYFKDGDANDHLQAGHAADEVKIEPLLSGGASEKKEGTSKSKSNSLDEDTLRAVLKHIGHAEPYYDEMIHKVCFPDAPNHEAGENAYVTRLTSQLINLGFTRTERVPALLHSIAVFDNSYHPVRRWLEEAEWDGQEGRIDKVLEGIETPINDELKCAIIKRWFYQIIAALYPEWPEEDFGIAGRRLEGVLVFSGKQGIGKTRWFKSLFPIPGAVKDGVTLRLDSKDSQLEALSGLVVELGEIDATFKKSDIVALKAFLSRSDDEIRRPYERYATIMPRRTVFGGTVNDHNFLNDPTGSRRFWVIPVEGLRPVNEMVDDTRQMWLEILEMYKFERNALKELGQYDRPVHAPSKEELEMIEESNLEHLNTPPIVERFLEEFYEAGGKLKIQVTSSFSGDRVYPYERDLTVRQILKVLDASVGRAEENWLRNYLEKTLGAKGRRTKHGRAYTLPRQI